MNHTQPLTRDATPSTGGAPSMATGYKHALWAADVFFGGFVILMVVTAAVGWLMGDAPLLDLLWMLAFLLTNIVLSEISRRTQRPYRVEMARLFVGGAVTTAAYVYMTGPLAPWWPGFFVLSLGGPIGFGLLTQRPFWGRVSVVVYLLLFTAAEVLRKESLDPYQYVLLAGVLATVGLMFAEIMSLLGRTLQQEHERSLEVKAARDALFAEIEVAQEIQTLLLPLAPSMPDHDIVGCMVTADEVGGDYYDVIESSERTLLAIGDVSGHGVASGLTMMMARTALVGALEAAPNQCLRDYYRVVNRCVRQCLTRMDSKMYMTLALLEHRGDGKFDAVGMHMPFLIYRAQTQTVEEIELRGVWLGIVDEIESSHLQQVSFELQTGDLLFLYTDGVTEQFADGEMFGFDRLKQILVDHANDGPARVADAVLAALREFSTDQQDDITMLLISNTGKDHASNRSAA